MGKKYIKIAIIAMLLVCVFATIVNAYSFTAVMATDSTTVAESKEFTVTVKVANLDVGTNGINSLSGYFKYDSSIFETINESSVEGINSWVLSNYNPENGKMTFTKTTFVKSEEEVFNVTLKTKTGVAGNEGEISFINVMASNSAQNISAADISTKITVGTPDTNDANLTNGTSNGINNIVINVVNNTVNNTTNNTVNNTVNNVVNNVVAPYVNNTNPANKVIDKAGVEDSVIYVMGALIVVAAVFYIKIEKINKEIK